jgi:SAM-dependent methyltransferase
VSGGASSFAVPGDSYDRFMGRYSGPLARAFADAVGVEAGQRALDVGCGPGALTTELVRRLGADSVSAIDPSEPFTAACAARNPGVDVRTGPAEAMPFADDAFGVALAQLVVQFMADAHAGVAEMRRVVAPGGAVAACVWDYAGGMRMLRLFWDASRHVHDDPPDEASRMRFAQEGHLAELLASAGLEDVRDGSVEVEGSYESFDDFWEPFTLGVGPAGAFVASLDDDRRARLREGLRDRLGDPSGPFTLPALAWYAVGRA